MKRSAAGDPDDANFEAKRIRRLGELLAEYGDDEDLGAGFVEVVAGGVTHRASPLLLLSLIHI